MSGLADNSYRAVLTGRAKLYGIRPAGQSFLHLELGTTQLLHAVDRYLKPGASVACLVPGTVFNGHHHEPLRQRKFISSRRSVALEMSEIWQVAPGTFKYPGAAIIGHKRSNVAGLDTEPAGALALIDGLEKAEFSTWRIGTKRRPYRACSTPKSISYPSGKSGATGLGSTRLPLSYSSAVSCHGAPLARLMSFPAPAPSGSPPPLPSVAV